MKKKIQQKSIAITYTSCEFVVKNLDATFNFNQLKSLGAIVAVSQSQAYLPFKKNKSAPSKIIKIKSAGVQFVLPVFSTFFFFWKKVRWDCMPMEHSYRHINIILALK